MSQFMNLDGETPATLEAVVAAVRHLRTLSEPEFLELASKGRVDEVFPYKPRAQELPPDFVDEEDLGSASALPLTEDESVTHIQASMPEDAKPEGRRFGFAAAVHALKKTFSSSED